MVVLCERQRGVKVEAGVGAWVCRARPAPHGLSTAPENCLFSLLLVSR